MIVYYTEVYVFGIRINSYNMVWIIHKAHRQMFEAFNYSHEEDVMKRLKDWNLRSQSSDKVSEP